MMPRMKKVPKAVTIIMIAMKTEIKIKIVMKETNIPVLTKTANTLAVNKKVLISLALIK